MSHALVAALVAERAVLREGRPWLQGTAGKVVLGLACALMVAFVLLLSVRRMRWAGVVMVVGATLLGVWMLSSRALVIMEETTSVLTALPVSECELRVASDSTPKERGYRCRAEVCVRGERGADVWVTLPQACARGSVLRCVGRFSPLEDDEWGESSRMQGVAGSIRVVRVLDACAPGGLMGMIQDFRSQVCEQIGCVQSPERALLAGCVCGKRDGLVAFGLDELFSRCGVSHLVAVSGGHLSVLVSLVTSVLGVVRLRPRQRFALTTGLGGLFVLFCGVPISAVRSWAMCVLSSSGNLVGRRSHPLSGVALVALVMALVDPTLSGQLGFVLSVSTVCGMCVFGAYATYVAEELVPEKTCAWVPRGVRRVAVRTRHVACASLATSVVAQVVTLPLVLSAFGEVSLVGPLANLVVAIPFSLFVGLGMVAVLLSWAPVLQALVLAACDTLAVVLIRVLGMLGALPQASVGMEVDAVETGLLVAVVLVAILVLWPRVSPRRVLAVVGIAVGVVAVLCVRWRFFAPARICVLDVGQGDAILVQDGGSAVLVDTGPGDAVVSALMRNHVMHLDAVVLTHLHEDHVGGLDDLVGSLGCDRVVVAGGVADDVSELLDADVRELTGHAVEEMGYADVLRVGGFSLEVVWPWDDVDGSENAHSLMLEVHYADGGASLDALLTGDAERDELAAVLARGDVGDIDLLKVGHHGSEVSITREEVAELDPEVSVASAGEGNSYGHPTQACVRVLESVGSRFLCTKDVGDVEVRPGTDGPLVSTQR